MFLESCDNETVKYFRRIRENKYIKEYKEFIVEGHHLVTEAIKSGYAKKIILLDGKSFDTSLPVVRVSEKVLKSISLLKTPQYIMAVCDLKTEVTDYGDKILLLDEVQDPGNVGTIIRTAVAFSIDTIILSENSVNIYNEKVIRSSQGMIFKINVVEKKIVDAIKEIKDKGIMIFGTDLKESKYLEDIPVPEKYALILGNEGKGIKQNILEKTDQNIKIKINENCESLNVAVCASIIMYEWRNK